MVPPTLGSGVFEGVPNSVVVHVPCGTTELYQAAEGWSDLNNYLEYFCPIDFADDNVKAICVANWDTDGDGELSYAEAAAVTSLGTAFKNNADITSFDELQYFTGLTSLPNASFMSCTNLVSISLPSSIASLGTGAFFNCTSLSVMTVYAETPPTAVSNTFGNVPSSLVVKVPCGTSDAYQAATGWSGFEHIVEMCGSVTQTLVLSAGDNWCSFYVETSLADVQNALTEALGTIQNNQNLQIQSQTKNVKFTRGSWRGELSSLDFARTYIITVPSDCEITVEGVPVDPAEHPITLAPGANWIGYPVNATMTINEAFGSSLPVNNDIVQSQEKNSIRTRGQWRGELGTLQPGKGYMYQSASTGERTFTFPQ